MFCVVVVVVVGSVHAWVQCQRNPEEGDGSSVTFFFLKPHTALLTFYWSKSVTGTMGKKTISKKI